MFLAYALMEARVSSSARHASSCSSRDVCRLKTSQFRVRALSSRGKMCRRGRGEHTGSSRSSGALASPSRRLSRRRYLLSGMGMRFLHWDGQAECSCIWGCGIFFCETMAVTNAPTIASFDRDTRKEDSEIPQGLQDIRVRSLPCGVSSGQDAAQNGEYKHAQGNGCAEVARQNAGKGDECAQ